MFSLPKGVLALVGQNKQDVQEKDQIVAHAQLLEEACHQIKVFSIFQVFIAV